MLLQVLAAMLRGHPSFPESYLCIRVRKGLCLQKRAHHVWLVRCPCPGSTEWRQILVFGTCPFRIARPSPVRSRPASRFFLEMPISGLHPQHHLKRPSFQRPAQNDTSPRAFAASPAPNSKIETNSSWPGTRHGPGCVTYQDNGGYRIDLQNGNTGYWI